MSAALERAHLSELLHQLVAARPSCHLLHGVAPYHLVVLVPGAHGAEEDGARAAGAVADGALRLGVLAVHAVDWYVGVVALQALQRRDLVGVGLQDRLHLAARLRDTNRGHWS